MNNVIVKFENLYHHYHQKDLFYGVSGTIFAGDKIGLIGHNGSGKTSLLRMIMGELKPYRGVMSVSAGSVGFIPQQIDKELSEDAQNLSLYDICFYLNSEIYHDFTVMSAMERGESVDTDKYLEALGNFQERGGYDYQNAINVLLSKAGIEQSRFSQRFSTLSEGQKRLMFLISALAKRNELLILDEPTNHVDSELKQKYIQLIREYSGAVLVVSHDRELLSEACSKIWEIRDQTLDIYNGNWEMYKAESQLRLKTRLEQYRLQHAEVERMEDLLARSYTGEANMKVSVAKTRLRREQSKLGRVPPKAEADTIRGSLNYEGKYSQFFLRIQDLAISFNGKRAIEGLTFDVAFGQKIALKGANGTGKTTLMRLILEDLDYAQYEGTIKVTDAAQIGYFSQKMHFDDESLSLLEYIRKLFHCDKSTAFGKLQKYLFDKAQADVTLKMLSGGERNRLQLMKLIEGNYNLLLLDEPTNHLDLPNIERIEEMLQQFNGSILLISHDQYFVDSVVDTVIDLNEYRVG